MMNPCKIWIEQCDAARGIEDQFGTAKALSYLIGEKFLIFGPAVGASRPERELTEGHRPPLAN